MDLDWKKASSASIMKTSDLRNHRIVFHILSWNIIASRLRSFKLILSSTDSEQPKSRTFTCCEAESKDGFYTYQIGKHCLIWSRQQNWADFSHRRMLINDFLWIEVSTSDRNKNSESGEIRQNSLRSPQYLNFYIIILGNFTCLP